MKLIIFFLIVVNLGCSHHRHHDSEMHNPHTPGEMNKKFLDPNLKVDTWVSDFESKDRDVIVYREEILKNLKLKKSEAVVDVGAGTGAFLKGLSDKVGASGQVIALDISPKFIEHMQAKIIGEKISNARVHLGQLETTSLPEKSVNMVFNVDTYHHFDNPVVMLQDFKKILKPKGKLVIIDFLKKDDSRDWVKHHIKMSKEDYIKQISSHGFRFLEEAQIPFKENFMLTFEAL